MWKPRVAAWMFAVGMMVAGAVSGQEYPARTIRIITGGAGGGNDIVARLIAHELTGRLGQQVIVDNRASGTIPGEVVAKAEPDGYTLVLGGRSFWIAPLMVSGKMPYHPVKDFSPITIPVRTVNILAVHPSLPVKSVKDLVALARARPGELNYGASGIGSSPHLAGELFNAVAGVNIVRINYRAMPAVYVDLMSGQVQVAFGSATSVAPHMKSGKMKALAVTSAQPSRLAPGLPTVAASGLPGYEFVSPFVMLAPARTPKPIVGRLHKEIVLVLNDAGIRDKLLNSKIGEAVGSSPEQVAAMMASEMDKLGRIIKGASGK
ncbi:MAG: tripartite tricarboxylate transporter substrate binding protein [Betaproteobacteria bacterium]|nr:tripartite tricarboxylate transporter substrate binding protein [Betaproteobacteria bacterium]